MKKLLLAAILLALLVAGFLALAGRGHSNTPAHSATSGRKILHYVDPMNPMHTSDKPGLAPCGMKMEPVYAEAENTSLPEATTGTRPRPAGTVKLSPERQQLIGVRVAEVKIKKPQHALRFPGRVAVDESRDYIVLAPINGWITKTGPYTTGSPIKKDEILASFYSPDFLSVVQSLVSAFNSRERAELTVQNFPSRIGELLMTDKNLERIVDTLLDMGMGQRQIDEILRTGTFTKHVELAAPADGFITARKATDGLRLEKGMELFRVADLSRVWVLTDVPGWEGEHLKPGSQARVSMPRAARTFVATVSQALPLFDNGSRTLKVRLEMDNPDHALRPDMLVDVELSVTLPEMILISADAVLDAGRRQTVFVEQGNGFYEPKEVKTGRHLGDLVEIVQGLTPGERIVTSGNFLLDSESRMKQAAAGIRGTSAKDPVCSMTVDEQEVEADGHVSVYQGHTYYFCNEGCKRSFDADPARVLSRHSSRRAEATLATEHPDHYP
ncbi:MAG: efflux RND transporter periplasmic adaptor subunit [Verrucomicrobia bacterium]|nr:efflux RND transporter periplasmic adaptor subunit [Verrucomicrobiota bacterium]